MNEAPSTPVCYRHPQRETHVRCVRCDRPICPDCMNQAPVGFQCPDCVREGQKSIRRPRTALGGAGGGNGIVTKTLVGINVGVFLVGLLWALGSGAGIGNLLTGGETPLHLYGALIPAPVRAQLGAQVVTLDGVAFGEYYRFLTSMFLHYGAIHLLFNMYVLWVIGQYLERELGAARYLGLYLVSGIGGGVLTYLLAAPNTAAAGASGCIFGLFGAMILINRKLGRDMSGVYVILGLNLVITFLPGTNISWTGHIGGLVTGLFLGFVLAHTPRKNRGPIQIAAFAAVVLVFIGLIAYRTSALTALFPTMT